MPKIRITLPGKNALPIIPTELFDAAKSEIWFEIGFGKGEHLAEMARRHPAVGFIGCEYFINGVAGLVGKIEEMGIENIRIYDDDARQLLEALAPSTLDRIFLLHPDPWPKMKHVKRRFINQKNLDELARVMIPGAILHVTSDHDAAVHWTLVQLLARNDFQWMAENSSHWKTPPRYWPVTRYQEKALKEGRKDSFLQFKFTGQKQ